MANKRTPQKDGAILHDSGVNYVALWTSEGNVVMTPELANTMAKQILQLTSGLPETNILPLAQDRCEYLQ